MRKDTLQHFVCPSCESGLLLERVAENEGDQIKTASLICTAGQHRFDITGFITRFVSTHDVTSSFGFEWNKHPKTQFDSLNGMRLSEERFFRQTNWPKNLVGEKILEVGSGAGRFTEIALQTGAQVFSIDASRAVEANWNNNGHHPNLILCQASLYTLPFPHDYFDKVFCFGVLQHTPDVALAFKKIAQFVRPGGELVVDVYNKNYWRNFHTPIYLIRPITKRIPHVPTHSKELLEQCSILDTFDTLSPQYISPQRPDTVRQWFLDAGYEDIEFDNSTVFYMRGRRKLAKNTADIPCRSDPSKGSTDAAAF